jgi:hypothetical protein
MTPHVVLAAWTNPNEVLGAIKCINRAQAMALKHVHGEPDHIIRQRALNDQRRRKTRAKVPRQAVHPSRIAGQR